MVKFLGEVLHPAVSRRGASSVRPDRDIEILNLQIRLLREQNMSMGTALEDMEGRLSGEDNEKNFEQQREEQKVVRNKLEEMLVVKENESNPFCGSAEYERQKTLLRLEMAEVGERQESQQLDISRLSKTVHQHQNLFKRFAEAAAKSSGITQNSGNISVLGGEDKQASLMNSQKKILKEQITREKGGLFEISQQIESIFTGVEELKSMRLAKKSSPKNLTSSESYSPPLPRRLTSSKKMAPILKTSRRQQEYVIPTPPLPTPPRLSNPPVVPTQLHPRRGRPILQGLLQKKMRWKTWKTMHAVLYRCDECYQLRLSNTPEFREPQVYNVVACLALLKSAKSPNSMTKAFELRIDPSDSAAPVLVLAAGADFGMWWSSLMDAVTFTEISTTTSLDVTLVSSGSSDVVWDLKNQGSI